MTGMIYGNCPKKGCVIWTPHTHNEGGGTVVLVAPVGDRNG